MPLTSPSVHRQLGTIDANLARLAVELRTAHSECAYAGQLHVLELIDVLLDRRLRTSARNAAAHGA